MRPDFIPPGQEAAHGIGKTGRYQDYVPGPLPDDLPVDQGGTGLAVPPDLLAPLPTPSPEAIAVPDPGPPASAIMSPGPMAEEGGTQHAARGTQQGEEPEAAPPVVAAEVMVPAPAPAEPGARSQEPGAAPKLTKAEREAIAAEAVEKARRLQEEADRHDEEEEGGTQRGVDGEEDVPEAGQKGGQAKSAQKPKGK